MWEEPIGWTSSAILLVTVTSQVLRQWRDRSGKLVSKWLFLGQAAASLGFTIYSVLLKNWVFTITNGLLLLSGLVGAAITLYHRRSSARHSESVGARHSKSVGTRDAA